MSEINVSFNEEELNALLALVDAALRANGVNALNASYIVSKKIEASRLAYYKAKEENKNS